MDLILNPYLNMLHLHGKSTAVLKYTSCSFTKAYSNISLKSTEPIWNTLDLC